MELLLGSTPTLALAALLLVIVASLPSLAGLRGRTAVPLCVMAVLAAVALVWHGVDRSRVMTNAFPSRVVRYAAQALNAAKASNVVLLEGGSYVLNGVDSTTVADELQALGYSVEVVRFAAGAANHFERYRMQQGIVWRLKRGPRAGQRWIYLAEAQSGYDRLPLAQFENNQDTDRSYHYLTLSNSWNAAQAVASPGVGEPLEGAWRWALFRHTLVNSFNAGLAMRLVPEDELDLSGGDVSPRRRQRFRFRGLDRLIAAQESPTTPAPQYSWTTKIREPRLRHLWQSYLSDFAYFGVPTTGREQLEYVRDFCKATKVKCIAPTDVTLLRALNNRNHWANATHLSLKGARIYSRWLARELAQNGLLTQ